MASGLYVYYGHHKCATSWVVEIVRFVAEYTGGRMDSFDNPRQYDGDLAKVVAAKGTNFLCLRNAKEAERQALPAHKGFHLIRDPRDILVSGYFSHRNSHSTDGWEDLVAHRERLQKLDQTAGLIAEMEFSATVFDDLASWRYGEPGVLELTYEQFLQNPYQAMLEAFDSLGLVDWTEPKPLDWVKHVHVIYAHKLRRRLGWWPCNPQPPQVPQYLLLGKCHQNRFSRLAGGRREGQENTQSHYRKGVAGDWMQHFTPEITAEFQARFPGLVERLGYRW